MSFRAFLPPAWSSLTATKKNTFGPFEVARYACSLDSLSCRWTHKNALFLERTIRMSAIIVIDDPQAAGLIPHIRTINPKSVDLACLSLLL